MLEQNAVGFSSKCIEGIVAVFKIHGSSWQHHRPAIALCVLYAYAVFITVAVHKLKLIDIVLDKAYYVAAVLVKHINIELCLAWNA